MDYRSFLLPLCMGFVVGIVVAEAVYYAFDPMILPEGAVKVVIDGEYCTRVSQLLSEAESSIHVAMFSMSRHTGREYTMSCANRLISQLAAAHSRGVDVWVVMDEWPEGNEKAKAYLEEANIPVTIIHGEGSLHNKLIIIDGRIVVVGSTNWSYYSLERNHEANVILNNAGVAEELESYLRSIST